MTDYHLELREITQQFGDRVVLDHICWGINQGQVTVLLGPNGAGKTTLLNILAGAQIPTTGQLYYKGEVYKDLYKKNYREKVGYLTEYPYYYPFLTVLESFHLIAKLRGLKPRALHSVIDNWVDFFSLQPFLTERMDLLSQGTRKRVCLLGCILHNPEILLLDEPTNGLDPEQIVVFKCFIEQMAKENKLIVISTHILGLAEDIAQDVVVLRNRQIIYRHANVGDLERVYLETSI